jgi:hypothetical protein
VLNKEMKTIIKKAYDILRALKLLTGTVCVLVLVLEGCATVPENGFGNTPLTDGGNYKGEFKNRQFHGQGTYTWANGGKYVGEFKDSKRDGQGTYTFANGDKYVGEWKNDMPNGQGIFYYLADESGIYKGDKYVGEVTEGKRHGQGTYFYVNGDTWVGEFKNGVAHDGFGVWNYLNGDRYKGEWRNGKHHGQGIFTFADQRRQEGYFENGQFIRETKVNFPKLENVATNTVRGVSEFLCSRRG